MEWYMGEQLIRKNQTGGINMGDGLSIFKEEIKAKVIRAYLVDEKSHRKIQEEILNLEAPARGGGFVAMQILHHYGIDGSKKGILVNNSFEDEYEKAIGSYKQGLDLLKKYFQ